MSRDGSADRNVRVRVEVKVNNKPVGRLEMAQDHANPLPSDAWESNADVEKDHRRDRFGEEPREVHRIERLEEIRKHSTSKHQAQLCGVEHNERHSLKGGIGCLR